MGRSSEKYFLLYFLQNPFDKCSKKDNQLIALALRSFFRAMIHRSFDRSIRKRALHDVETIGCRSVPIINFHFGKTKQDALSKNKPPRRDSRNSRKRIHSRPVTYLYKWRSIPDSKIQEDVQKLSKANFQLRSYQNIINVSRFSSFILEIAKPFHAGFFPHSIFRKISKSPYMQELIFIPIPYFLCG